MARLSAAVLGFLVFASDSVAAPRALAQEEQVRRLYSFYRVERAALSPDGRRVAFALVNGNRLEFEVYDTSNPNEQSVIQPPAPVTSLDFFAWASSDRLVAVTGEGDILVSDGQKLRMREVADPASFAAKKRASKSPARLRVLGFTTGEPDRLEVEINAPVTDDVTSLELHRVDLATGRHERSFHQDLNRRGGSLIVDRQGQARLVFTPDRVPQRFDYWEAGRQGGGGKNLDAVLSDRTTFSFGIVPGNFLGERTIPVGFGTDPNLLYYATNLGRDGYALGAVEVSNGRCLPLVLEDATADVVGFETPWMQSPLVFDRRHKNLVGVRLAHGEGDRWFDAEIETVHGTLAKEFPDRRVQLLEWDDARERFLMLISGPANPGRYFVYDRRTDQSTEYFQRLPEIDPEQLGRTERLILAAPTGGQFKAHFTSPRHENGTAPPLVVWLYDGPWKGRPAGFSRDAHALAALGYATLEVEYAGSSGDGRARRERVRRGYDRIPLEEVLNAMDALQGRSAFDPARVAIVGDGFGGYLALRGLQLHPARFQCGVAINSVTDPADLWRADVVPGHDASLGVQANRGDLTDAEAVDARAAAEFEAATARVTATQSAADFEVSFARWVRKESEWKNLAVTPEAARLTQPVLLFHDPGNPRVPRETIAALRREMKRLGHPAEYFQLTPKTARVEVTMRIHEFLKDRLRASGRPVEAR